MIQKLLLKWLTKSLNVDPCNYVVIIFTGNDQIEVWDDKGEVIKYQF